MHTSETINEIAAALAKAQGEMAGAKKDSTNPHFRSKYADLASVWEACRGALSSNGIAVVQALQSDDPEIVGVTTVLTHSSGQWMSSGFCMRPTKADPQGIGSCVTYARRYALAAMVGVAPEDDDGEGAHGRGTQGQPVDVKAKAQAQHAAVDTLRAAIEANDPWPVWSLRVSQEEAYKAACTILNTKEKAAVKELETKGGRMSADYPMQLANLSVIGDEHGTAQLWDELTKLGKELVWADLDKQTREFIRNLKKEAA